MPFIPYDPHLKAFAAKLRKNSTLAEVLLWQRLKHGQVMGYDFHRQKPILHWIADFFCPELMLVVEIDGDSHLDRVDADRAKDAGFAELGITVLRFGDSEVKKNTGVAIDEIKAWILARRTRE